ncbi:expressed unknown protein [Seminavis robusta]|uniref:Uncharacterized protein n=1 Tax=Seminavis robusta TaxID=568900 RepID=A0A9N8ESF1_9STRA|nr:expressed unknown protein [Seminavis robusta]|eukprot:Sro1746_g294980.1 n/a (258) ;mRNA; r:7155-7928
MSHHLVAGAISAALLSINPAPVMAASDVVTGTQVEAAIVQISKDAYPVLSSMQDVSPLTSKLMGIVDKKIPAAKASEALDKGIDSFLSIPDEKVSAFATVVQSAYTGVSGDSCQSLGGSAATSQQFASLPVVQGLDATKVKALQDKFAPANKAVPSSSGGGDICLPASSQGLEQIWVGQTELTLNIPKAESKAFVASLSKALSVVPTPEWLKLLPDAKKSIVGNVDAKMATKLEKSGKTLEKAFQADDRIQKRLSSS